MALGIPQHRFPFPFLAVCPLFFSAFGDCQIPRRHPAAFVVDKFFPSASSSHCLLSTNAVVGRSFTYSMVGFHNSLGLSQHHVFLNLDSQSGLFVYPIRASSSHRYKARCHAWIFQVWSYSENWRRRQVTLHLAGAASHFRVQAFGF